jgi:mono/diheme cytochrome c family protein
VASLDANDPAFEHHLLEALWVTWGQGQVDAALLERCLGGKKPELRAAATRVVRHEFRKIPNAVALLKRSAADENPRVRLEALVASSWVGGEPGAEILLAATRKPLDSWMENAALFAMVPLKPVVQELVQSGRASVADNPVARGYLGRDLRFSANNASLSRTIEPRLATRLGEEGVALWKVGQEVFSRDGHCSTCHQPEGEGLAKIYPPLARSEWVTGDEDRLIKLVLHGLMGPIVVRGESYAEGLTPYVRTMFGNRGNAITPAKVKAVREATTGRKTFYQTTELLKEHPFETADEAPVTPPLTTPSATPAAP